MYQGFHQVSDREASETQGAPRSHYYGDVVRRLFTVAAIILGVTTPFVSGILPVPSYVAPLAAVGFIIVAGFTNPKLPWSAPLNFAVSVIGLLLFQYRATIDYLTLDGSFPRTLLFIAEELLVVVLLIALYFSVKTFRSKLIEQ